MRKIEVTEANPDWPELFLKEKARLEQIDPENIVNIFHIGSTSVPGLAAKPVIDILMVVKMLASLNIQKIEDLAYNSLGENGIAERHFFIKGGDQRSHHVHVFQYNNVLEIQRHLAFRNYLRKNPAAREEYAQLKKSLAAKYPFDIEAYIAGKDQLVKEIERKALIDLWRKEQS